MLKIKFVHDASLCIRWLVLLAPYKIDVCNKWSFKYRINLWNKIYHWNRNDLMALCNFFYWVLGQKINLIGFIIILTWGVKQPPDGCFSFTGELRRENWSYVSFLWKVFYRRLQYANDENSLAWFWVTLLIFIYSFEGFKNIQLVPLKSWENVDIPRALIYYSTSSRKV